MSSGKHDSVIATIGDGQLGGKAAGLDLIRRQILTELGTDEFPAFSVDVPRMLVLTTQLFDHFLQRNQIEPSSLEDLPDDRIAHRFQEADLPAEYVGELLALVERHHTPLAVRSSSLLEDSLHHPFAGVYGTKMIPNNQSDVAARFHRLIDAVKYVYASTYFRQAQSYLRSIQQGLDRERMAVIIQEVVGRRGDERFYPHLSGVARSYNYYPTGAATPEDGVVNLALGLGKQIVDGGLAWTYSPPYPAAPAPFAGVGDLLKNTQTQFWAVHLGPPPLPDPMRETEYLIQGDLSQAEWDGSLDQLVSTYDSGSDRLRPGLIGSGPRVLDFAPLLQHATVPLNDLLRRLLEISERVLKSPVEIEFAVTLPTAREERARFGFLQVRPMMVSRQEVDVPAEDLADKDILLASEHVLGNGLRTDIQDVVYVKPRAFEARHTPRIAQDLERINLDLLKADRPCLLIGFGRWGSSDPWLGVPVEWGQISAARVIVEATLPGMNPDLSQGSHFFHNLIGLRVLYLSLRYQGPHAIDWDWLDEQEAASETEFVRHVRLAAPLAIRVDGRHGRGVIKRHV